MLNSYIYHVLKPRLQYVVKDLIFQEFYKTFEFIFQGCSQEFIRKVLSKAKLEVHFGTHPDDKDTQGKISPIVLIKQNQMLPNLHLILSGKVYITDSSLKNVYGSLSTGSCIGDIPLLQEKPSRFCYVYNTYSSENLYLLTISYKDFLFFCDRNQNAKQILKEKTFFKEVTFDAYKRLWLLSIIKCMNFETFHVEK